MMVRRRNSLMRVSCASSCDVLLSRAVHFKPSSTLHTRKFQFPPFFLREVSNSTSFFLMGIVVVPTLTSSPAPAADSNSIYLLPLHHPGMPRSDHPRTSYIFREKLYCQRGEGYPATWQCVGLKLTPGIPHFLSSLCTCHAGVVLTYDG